ncbi:MAG: UDP-N-acetylmuramoyl-L-alanine--D-glutamate ligase, partial [Spirochaetaceae bacterium]
SPLTFLDEIDARTPVVLELSSWQLADLRGRDLLAPLVSVLTVILPDHQDRYPNMESYIADKKIIFSEQTTDQYALFNHRDPLQHGFGNDTRAQVLFFSMNVLPAGLEGAFLLERGAMIRMQGRDIPLELDPLSIPGAHNRLNLLAAALACSCYGLPVDQIAPRLRGFPGVEHRLELAAEINGVRYYNDSAATIPEATAAALQALDQPIILITGGTDKRLDFHSLLRSIDLAETVILLQGSATEKMQAMFNEQSVAYLGPFASLEAAVHRAAEQAKPGTSVLFSPGCASFELFLNEFDRGRKFKQLVEGLRLGSA